MAERTTLSERGFAIIEAADRFRSADAAAEAARQERNEAQEAYRATSRKFEHAWQLREAAALELSKHAKRGAPL